MSEVLCINLGKDSVKLSLINEQLDNQEYQRFSTPEIFSELIDNIVEYYKYFKNKYDIIGCSVGCCGIIDNNGLVIGNSIEYLEGVNIQDILRSKLNIECCVENDVHCMSIAEMEKGALKDINNAVYMFLGPEIRGSIIINHQIIKGDNFLSGNFQNILVRDRRGHLNTLNDLVSIKSMIKKIEAIDDDIWNDKRLFEEAKKGNDKCENIVNTFFMQLGIELLNIQQFINPDVLVIGGVIEDQENFIKILNKSYHKINKQVDVGSKPKVIFSNFSDNADMIGAYVNYMKNKD